MSHFDLMFDDLNQAAQGDLLEFMGKKDPKELNWDVLPIATITKGD